MEEEKSNKIQQRLLNIKETAVYLNKTVWALYQMISRRQIPFVKMGDRVYFDSLRLNEWIKEKTIEEAKF